MLRFHAHTYFDPHDFIFPQVRHMVYYCHCHIEIYELYEISCICPDLEILELKTAADIGAGDEESPHLFRKLEKFMFRPVDATQLDYVGSLFKNMSTEVIIDDSVNL